MKPLPLAFALFLFTILSVAADESFEKYDTNGDKMVTYEELLRFKTFEFDKLDRNRDRSIAEEEFDRLDEDSVSKYELFHSSNFGTPYDIGVISLIEYEEHVRRIINRLDTSADNAVSEEEYAAAVAEAKARDAALEISVD